MSVLLLLQMEASFGEGETRGLDFSAILNGSAHAQ